jgi:hypothetical protein
MGCPNLLLGVYLKNSASVSPHISRRKQHPRCSLHCGCEVLNHVFLPFNGVLTDTFVILAQFLPTVCVRITETFVILAQFLTSHEFVLS